MQYKIHQRMKGEIPDISTKGVKRGENNEKYPYLNQKAMPFNEVVYKSKSNGAIVGIYFDITRKEAISKALKMANIIEDNSEIKNLPFISYDVEKGQITEYSREVIEQKIQEITNSSQKRTHTEMVGKQG